MSIVRKNLMSEKGYSPYCGAVNCYLMMPRTKFNGSQFTCQCGWVSEFPGDFIHEYVAKWNISTVERK